MHTSSLHLPHRNSGRVITYGLPSLLASSTNLRCVVPKAKKKHTHTNQKQKRRRWCNNKQRVRVRVGFITSVIFGIYEKLVQVLQTQRRYRKKLSILLLYCCTGVSDSTWYYYRCWRLAGNHRWQLLHGRDVYMPHHCCTTVLFITFVSCVTWWPKQNGVWDDKTWSCEISKASSSVLLLSKAYDRKKNKSSRQRKTQQPTADGGFFNTQDREGIDYSRPQNWKLVSGLNLSSTYSEVMMLNFTFLFPTPAAIVNRISPKTSAGESPRKHYGALLFALVTPRPLN